jgi:quinol monooxygenase YgiN
VNRAGLGPVVACRRSLRWLSAQTTGTFRMIHVIATIRTVSAGRDTLLTAFRELVPLVRAEPGCIEYETAVDLATPIRGTATVRDDVVTVIEKWESVAALEDHLAAPHMLKHRERVKELVTTVEIRVLSPA